EERCRTRVANVDPIRLTEAVRERSRAAIARRAKHGAGAETQRRHETRSGTIRHGETDGCSVRVDGVVGEAVVGRLADRKELRRSTAHALRKLEKSRVEVERDARRQLIAAAESDVHAERQRSAASLAIADVTSDRDAGEQAARDLERPART